MDWTPLISEEQLKQIKERSFIKPQVIFKHSTRCSVSHVSLNRLNRTETPAQVDFYLLDLLQYRQLSNRVSTEFEVYHESPQALLIKNGECTYDESHMAITLDEILEQAIL